MEERKILIVTKTYPSISTKYKETVCTAGILLNDEEKPIQWIRIYPIRFRQLEFDRRYLRWSAIRARIERNDKDYRNESYRIDDSSIKVVRSIGSENNWQERKSFILPLQFQSISEIKAQNRSLGLIKPQMVNKYFCQPTERNWNLKQQAVLDQLDLFEPSVELEKIPYNFGYEFIDQDGNKHRYTISDWEIKELYRKCRDSSKESTLEKREQEAIEKVRQKLEGEFLQKKDLYFVVGNLKNHKETFMIIGVIYPPIVQHEQLSLF